MASPACPNPPPSLPKDGKVSYLSGKRVSAFEYIPGKVAVRYVDVQTDEETTLSGDVLISADGIHSTVRRLVNAPTLERYAGYVSWRGTVPERELSEETCHYVVPTDDGNFKPRERLVNFVAAPFTEVLAKVQAPFVTKINDAISASSSFHDGRVVLVGDAFASFRPHAAAATEQCAFHCQTLAQVYSGQMTMVAWERETRHYERHMVLLNHVVGDFGRGAVLSLLQALISYAIFLIWKKFRRG
ncbi:hypothetical protein F5Y16DRAFT_393545 [Xylariaceae sp. FL0255]|nr:hypothetical protein F5Y16DRAFT_393545 [Xylariaceae sp. FL0255]